jgi:IclR family transcriptional regulator, blcABC operon repressor
MTLSRFCYAFSFLKDTTASMSRTLTQNRLASPPAAVLPSTSEKNLAPAVLKASQVLDVFAQSSSPLSLAELVRQLDMPKSTAHTICNTLVHLRLLTRLEGGQMALGPHLMSWANAFVSRSEITQEFFAAWDEVSVLPQETITLSVLDGSSVVYIACRNGDRPLGVTFRTGMRLPAPFTATGKAMLSTLSDDEIRQVLDGPWPEQLTAAGTRGLETLLEQIGEIRRRGYSIDRGEVRDGMHCFGAPVFDSSGKSAVAGVAVSLLSLETDPAMQEKAGHAIRTLANRLSERLGASPAHRR